MNAKIMENAVEVKILGYNVTFTATREGFSDEDAVRQFTDSLASVFLESAAHNKKTAESCIKGSGGESFLRRKADRRTRDFSTLHSLANDILRGDA